MTKTLTSEMKAYKEEFDFLHKKIGEIEWELTTLYYERKGTRQSEIEILYEQLENYKDSKGLLIEKTEKHITETKNMI